MIAPPPRILMTTDAVGGVWRYTLDLARRWKMRGTRPVVALLGPVPESARAEESGLAVVHTGLPLDWTAPNAGMVSAAAQTIAHLAQDCDASSIHLHTPALVPDACPVPVVAVAHSCVRTWWQAVRGGTPLPSDLAWRAGMVDRGLRCADAVIAPSHSFASVLRGAYGPVLDIVVIRNGGERWSGPDRRKAARAITAGRLWDEGKNVDTLDRAAGRIATPVLAAGPAEGPNGARIQTRHLKLLGPLLPRQLERLVSSSRIFVSLSRYEPFGLAVLEAAQTGAALVLSDIPTFHELWDGAAVFVPPDDDAAAAVQIAALAEAPGDWSGRARERAQAYTAETMADATLAVHRRLALASETRRAA